MSSKKLKLPIECGSKDQYSRLNKRPGYIYIITDASINEPTLYLGSIPLTYKSFSNKVISSINFNEDALSILIEYNDGTSESVSLYDNEIITTVEYDNDNYILRFNNDIEIDLSGLKQNVTNIITDATNKDLLPTIGAVLNYIDSMNVGNLDYIFGRIADTLRIKQYFPEADTLLGIIDCIMGMNGAEVISPKASSKISRFLYGTFRDEFNIRLDLIEFTVSETLQNIPDYMNDNLMFEPEISILQYLLNLNNPIFDAIYHNRVGYSNYLHDMIESLAGITDEYSEDMGIHINQEERSFILPTDLSDQYGININLLARYTDHILEKIDTRLKSHIEFETEFNLVEYIQQLQIILSEEIMHNEHQRSSNTMSGLDSDLGELTDDITIEIV